MVASLEHQIMTSIACLGPDLSTKAAQVTFATYKWELSDDVGGYTHQACKVVSQLWPASGHNRNRNDTRAAI